jgi:hypothetical protein
VSLFQPARASPPSGVTDRFLKVTSVALHSS